MLEAAVDKNINKFEKIRQATETAHNMESPTISSPSLPLSRALPSESEIPKFMMRRHSVEKPNHRQTETNKPTQTRELSNENNILHKENERKDHRIQALTKEIQTLRTTHSNDQRELKIMANTIDLLKKEKAQLDQERRVSHSKMSQLQGIVEQQNNSHLILQDNEKLVKDNSSLKLTISSLQGELLLRKKEISQLSEDLQIAALTIQTQNNFENAIFYDQLQPTTTSLPVKTNLSLSFGKNREVLKQLYFDLSKKTINNQSLSEELANNNKTQQQLQDKLHTSLIMLERAREENNRLMVEKEEWEKRSEEEKKNGEELAEQLKKETERAQSHSNQSSELTKRLTEYRITAEKQKHEMNYEKKESEERLKRSEETAKQLQQTLLTLSDELQQLQQTLSSNKQQHEEEKSLLLQQQEILAEKLLSLQQTERSNEQLRLINEQNESSFLQLQTNYNTLEQEKYDLKAKLSYLSFFLQKEKDISNQLQTNYDDLLSSHKRQEEEKEEVMKAFQQLLLTSKELIAQHGEAKKEIIALQQELKERETVKENMNSAILTALFDERMKSMISRQIDSDSLLQQQLHHNNPHSNHNNHNNLASNNNHSNERPVAFATLTLPSSYSSSSPSQQMEEVVDRISRGDFDWLNDDNIINSVLQESLNQSQSIPHQPINPLNPLPTSLTTAMTTNKETQEIIHTRQKYANSLHQHQQLQQLQQLTHQLDQQPPHHQNHNNPSENNNSNDNNDSVKRREDNNINIAANQKSDILRELDKFQQEFSQINTATYQQPTNIASSTTNNNNTNNSSHPTNPTYSTNNHQTTPTPQQNQPQNQPPHTNTHTNTGVNTGNSTNGSSGFISHKSLSLPLSVPRHNPSTLPHSANNSNNHSNSSSNREGVSLSVSQGVSQGGLGLISNLLDITLASEHSLSLLAENNSKSNGNSRENKKTITMTTKRESDEDQIKSRNRGIHNSGSESSSSHNSHTSERHSRSNSQASFTDQLSESLALVHYPPQTNNTSNTEQQQKIINQTIGSQPFPANPHSTRNNKGIDRDRDRSSSEGELSSSSNGSWNISFLSNPNNTTSNNTANNISNHSASLFSHANYSSAVDAREIHTNNNNNSNMRGGGSSDISKGNEINHNQNR